MGPIGSEPSARNYHFLLRNTTKEKSSHPFRDGSPKSRKLQSDHRGVDFEVGAISLVSVDVQTPCVCLSHTDEHVDSLSLDLKEFRSTVREALRHDEAERRGDFRYVLFLTELAGKTGLLTL
jgi:hypothetical protein